MNNYIKILDKDFAVWTFNIRFYSWRMNFNFKVPNVCVFNIYKHNDHLYSFRCFFYDNDSIFVYVNIKSKKDLCSKIQSIIDEHITYPEQFCIT